MITSIFNKSKPLNFFIIAFILLVALAFSVLKFEVVALDGDNIFKLILAFLATFFSVLVVNFIVYKNGLSQRGNYEMLVYSLFLLALPQTVTNLKIVVSNVFVLLALRRILNISSLKFVVRKLFDSGILIGIASLFYFWSILFLVLAVIVPFLYSDYKVKNIMAPILGVISIYIVAICVSILATNTYVQSLDIMYYMNFNFSHYNSKYFIISITLIFSYGVWASTFYLRNIKMKMNAMKPNFLVVFYALIVGLVIAIIARYKTGAEFLFALPPLAIITASYIETIEEKWFKETMLLVLLAVPLISFLF